MSLKIGTVFSGIGAIEHALKRMDIPYEIEFACDTGDVDIFSRKMEGTYQDTKKAFDEMREEIANFVSENEEDKEFIIKLEDEVVSLWTSFSKLPTNATKSQIRKVKELISMSFEKLNTQKVRQKLRKIENYKDKKQFVDDLYKSKEKNNKVKQTYMTNYPITNEQWHYNVCFMDGRQWRDKIDIFMGGSPCQSFSAVGKRRGLEDTRGTLFFEFARLISEINPKVFLYENVRGLLNHDKGNTWKIMQEVFDSLGYNYYYQLLDAKDYGIPQNRKRVFVVGFRKDLQLKQEFKFPEPIPLTLKMQDFLLDNVSGRYYLTKNQVKFVNNEERIKKGYVAIDSDIALCQLKHQQFNLAGNFVFVEENKDMEKTMQELDKYFLSEKLIRYVMDENNIFWIQPETDKEIASTLLKTMHKMHRAGVDNYVHTKGRLRKLTPRECFRLMGFCDSYIIPVADTAAYMQAGNSIVVDVLIYLLNAIFKTVEF